MISDAAAEEIRRAKFEQAVDELGFAVSYLYSALLHAPAAGWNSGQHELYRRYMEWARRHFRNFATLREMANHAPAKLGGGGHT